MAGLDLLDHLRDWVELLNRDYGMGLHLTPEGQTGVQAKDGTVAQIEAPPGMALMVFSTTLGPAPVDDVAALRRLLALNLLGVATHGGAIAIDPASDEIVFSFTWQPDEPSFEVFGGLIGGFIATASELKAAIAAEAPPVAAPRPAERMTRTDSPAFILQNRA